MLDIHGNIHFVITIFYKNVYINKALEYSCYTLQRSNPDNIFRCIRDVETTSLHFWILHICCRAPVWDTRFPKRYSSALKHMPGSYVNIQLCLPNMRSYIANLITLHRSEYTPCKHGKDKTCYLSWLFG